MRTLLVDTVLAVLALDRTPRHSPRAWLPAKPARSTFRMPSWVGSMLRPRRAERQAPTALCWNSTSIPAVSIHLKPMTSLTSKASRSPYNSARLDATPSLVHLRAVVARTPILSATSQVVGLICLLKRAEPDPSPSMSSSARRLFANDSWLQAGLLDPLHSGS